MSSIKLLSTSLFTRSTIIPRWSRLTIQPCVYCSTSRLNVPTYIPLLDVVKSRQAQARRSVLVQVAGPDSASDLSTYCQDQFGKVASLHYYNNTANKNFTDFFIVEFVSSTSVDEVLGNAQHSAGEGGGLGPVPVYSPFLWLQGGMPGKVARNLAECNAPVDLGRGDLSKTEQQIRNIVGVADQMFYVWKMNTMTDTSLRLRFLVSRQVELAISGMFPMAQVLPFGSSVNGFGSCSSDQDMILILDKEKREETASRLVFQAKGAVFGGERAQVQRYCDEVASIIQSFLPGCQDIQKILNARVPLIKYTHHLAGLECDLSMSSSSGLHMSCLLHLWGEMDWRVKPLVSTVRKWAKRNGLVKDVRPTHFFTNFTLTMLVVCYLQQVHSMLPSLNTLVEKSTTEDSYLCEDGVNIRFLHNISGQKEELNMCYSSSLSLSDLFQDFLSFYSTYSFTSLALCPISGSSKSKDRSWRNSSALDMINPLEPDLNVSYNINKRALDLFQIKCLEGINKLELLKEAEKRGEVVNEGLFWLLNDHHKVSSKAIKLSVPRLEDLGIKQERQSEKISSNEFKMSVDLSRMDAITVEKEYEIPSNNTKKERMAKFKVKDLFTEQVKKSKSKDVTNMHETATVDSAADERVEELKAKYLRTKGRSSYSFKL